MMEMRKKLPQDLARRSLSRFFIFLHVHSEEMRYRIQIQSDNKLAFFLSESILLSFKKKVKMFRIFLQFFFFSNYHKFELTLTQTGKWIFSIFFRNSNDDDSGSFWDFFNGGSMVE